MPEAVKTPPTAVLRSLPISKDARTAFEKYGVDIGKLEDAEKKVEKTADRIADRQDAAHKLVNDSAERTDKSSKRADEIYKAQTGEFEKAVGVLSTKTEFKPEQTAEVNLQKERHLKERIEEEKRTASTFEAEYESATHKLGQFEVEATGQALDLAVGAQRMFDQFIEVSEKKLAAVASPEQREAALAEIRTDATELINKVVNLTSSLLTLIETEQKKICGEVGEGMSTVFYAAKMRIDELLTIQSRENTKLVAELKLNADFSKIPDADKQKDGFDGMSDNEKLRYYFDKKMSKEEKLACCDPEEVLTRVRLSLKLAESGEAEYTEVKGPLTLESVSAITKNAEAELAKYKDELAEDAYEQCLQLVHRFDKLIRDTVEAKDENGKSQMAGVSAEDMDLVMRDSVQKVVVQDIEARKRQLGDHGVRHIAGNIRTQETIFDALDEAGHEPPITSRQRLIAAFIQVNHDMGYVSAMAMAVSDTYHKQYGQKIFDAQKDKFIKIFGQEDANFMSNAILTHDDASIDWKRDPINSAIRLADNLALYASEKLPALFRNVPGASDVLLEMLQVATAKDTKKFNELKDELEIMVLKSDLKPNMKRDLIFAVAELKPRSPEFTIGMLAGEVSGISFDKERNCLVVNIAHDADAEVLAKLNYNELAVRQVVKFAKSLKCQLGDPNQTAFDLVNDENQLVVHLDVSKTDATGTFGERTLAKLSTPPPVLV